MMHTPIHSERGVQQGDPIGPLLFSATIHPLVSQLRSELNVWYLDDGTLGGSTEDVIHDIQKVIGAQAEYGLELNITKCEAYMFGGTEDDRVAAWDKLVEAAPGIRNTPELDLCLLGAPLTEDAIPSIWEEKCGEVEKLVKQLNILQAHHALFLLKSCLGLPKVTHLLRCAPLWKFPEKLERFDSFMKQSVEKIVNVKLEENEWIQASLPVNRAGLGIRKTEEVALSAYLASTNFVSPLVLSLCPLSWEERKEEAQNQWASVTGLTLPDVADRCHQRTWDKPIVDKQFNVLLQRFQGNPRALARLLAAAERESGAWLHALPAASLGNLLDQSSLRIAVALRLGAMVCLQHQCRCGKMVDQTGVHGLACKYSQGRHSRHTEINKIIQRALITAGFPTIREPPGLARENGKRPDGQTMIPFKQGQTAVWDFTTVDTGTDTYLAQTSQAAGKAAEEAERKKKRKYEFLDGRCVFYPVGFETFGTWGPSAKEFLGRIGQLLKEATFESRSYEFFRQRLSIALQRGNASSVLGTLPLGAGLTEIFRLVDV